MRRRSYWKALALLLLPAFIALLAALEGYSWQLERSTANGLGTLRLVTSGLDSYLKRYEPLPRLAADRPEIVDLLGAPQDPDRRQAANLYLKDLAQRLSVLDIYVMLPDGETIAASNFDAISFVGQNFRYRPYFQAAAEGSQGRFYGLGTTSDLRGYYFSDPVWVDGRVGGIVAFKIDLDGVEASWPSNDTEIMVLDPANIVFMAGRPAWRYRVFGASDPAALRETREVLRYADEAVEPLRLRGVASPNGRPMIGVEEGGSTREFVVLRQPMAEAGWTVAVLVDTAPAYRFAVAVGLSTFLLIALVLSAVLAVLGRRRRAAERRQEEAAVKRELERRVDERTGALALANERLQEEIAERASAETRLRRTQADLVEAGKLAALGQMSAALSHEFNQPLAAASAYADNAGVFLERGATGEAKENIARIASLLDRLSSISRHLRAFARRPDEELGPVDVGAAVEGALAIIEHRINAVDARLDVAPGLDGLFVTGVAVRLQQVLVNLLANACDAVEGRDLRRIAIGWREERASGQVLLFVEDSGPGVPGAIAPRIFDPFFTSKAVGKGLGLGLSISYNVVRDFGGHLRLGRGEEGGARFTLELCAAASPGQETAAQ